MFEEDAWHLFEGDVCWHSIRFDFGGYNCPMILKKISIRCSKLWTRLKRYSDKYPTKWQDLVPYRGIFARTSLQTRSIFWVCAPVNLKNKYIYKFNYIYIFYKSILPVSGSTKLYEWFIVKCWKSSLPRQL